MLQRPAASPPSVVNLFSAGARLDTGPYSATVRAERLIAVARTVLALFALLTIYVNPDEPVRYAQVSHALFLGYAIYSMVLLAVVWISHAALKPLRLPTQAADLLLYTLFVYLTGSFTSPLSAYLVFSILSATVRWRARGAVLAAAAAILAYVGLGLYVQFVVRDPAFELDRFIFHTVYLAVVAGILTTLGAHEARIRGELARLANWPRPIAAEPPELIRQLLAHAAGVLRAPRVLLVADEPEEPWTQVALWSPAGFELRREPPGRYSPAVAEALEGRSFMCRDVDAADARVLCADGDGLREWRGRAFAPGFQADFNLHAVLALPLPGDRLSGWLIYLDKRGLSTDDVALGTITAREVVASLDHADLVALGRRTAVIDERTRLGRDLHDGLLQSLTAVRLQLHQLSRQVAGAATREKLRAVEASISVNQQDLRRLIEELHPRDEAPGRALAGFAEEVDELCTRVQQQWGIAVQTRLQPQLQLAPALRREVAFMVHEALVNAVRHGGASAVELTVCEDHHRLMVAVADNGRGFAFEGRRDAVQLAREHAGPVSLRERVTSLAGTIVVDSGYGGARIELTIPLGEGA